jgi:hypothetical protein
MSTSLLDGVLFVFAAYVSWPVDFPVERASGEKPMEEIPNRAEPGEFNHNDCADERLKRKVRGRRSPRLVLSE